MNKEELEKEAEEYAKQWIVEEDVDALMQEAYIDGAEPREKQIEALEKEKCELLGIIQGKDKAIAELKEKIEHRNCVDCSNHGSNMKLIKAKELLKKCYDDYIYLQPLRDEIKHFLSN